MQPLKIILGQDGSRFLQGDPYVARINNARSSIRNAMSVQHSGEFGPGTDTKLAIHPRQMRLDRLAGHEQRGGNLKIVLATSCNPRNLQFLGLRSLS